MVIQVQGLGFTFTTAIAFFIEMLTGLLIDESRYLIERDDLVQRGGTIYP